jgi:tRNA (guanine37-N1)-methyltransferase
MPESRLRVDVFSIFPPLVDDFLSASLVGRARARGIVSVRVHDLRSRKDPRQSVDDSPLGGGAGMVLRPDAVFEALEAAGPARPVYLLGPGGRRFDQSLARILCRSGGFSLLCGRYEGVDQRVADHLVDEELSIGDFVLAGGEVAAMAVVEAVARLVPGVMGNIASAGDESFVEGLLEYPQYTRPATYRGWSAPEVLLSGDHRRVARWRRAESLARTLAHRPDLVAARGGLTREDVRILRDHGYPVSFPWPSEERVAP